MANLTTFYVKFLLIGRIRVVTYYALFASIAFLIFCAGLPAHITVLRRKYSYAKYFNIL